MTKQESTKKAPDPQQLAATYAQVAQRASKLLTDHMQRQMKHGIKPPTDELGVAKAFFDMASKMFANPYKVMQAQLGLVWDYYSLWQNSMMRIGGMSLTPMAAQTRWPPPSLGRNHAACSLHASILILKHIRQGIRTSGGLVEFCANQGCVRKFQKDFSLRV